VIQKLLNRWMRSGARKKYAHYETGAMALATGLTVQQGDLDLNWLYDIPERYTEAASGSRSARRTTNALDIEISGEIRGRRAELVWKDGASLKRGVLRDTVKYSFDGRASVTASAGWAPFEVVHRKAQGVIRPWPQLEAPERVFTDVMLADRFRLQAGDADIAGALEPCMAQFATAHWVHLLWDGERLSLLLRPDTIFALDGIAERFDALVGAAEALEAGWKAHV
jgi:hypothetical protein